MSEILNFLFKYGIILFAFIYSIYIIYVYISSLFNPNLVITYFGKTEKLKINFDLENATVEEIQQLNEDFKNNKIKSMR